MFHGLRVRSHVMKDLHDAGLEHLKGPEPIHGLEGPSEQDEDAGTEEDVGPAHHGLIAGDEGEEKEIGHREDEGGDPVG